MLESTQEILEKLDPLLDVGDMQSAGRLLVEVDLTSLRALLIHISRERGTSVADGVGKAYLQEHAAWMLEHKKAS